VASICVGLVDRELNGTQEAHTAGERAFRRYGLTGARGEAASGYATVRTAALPIYDRLRMDGVDEDVALLQVLLHRLAVNDDTNLVSRGGLAGLDYVNAYARKLLWEGGALAPHGLKKMAAFDDALVARHLSPGGTADLPRLTWLLAQFPTQVRAVERQVEDRGARSGERLADPVDLVRRQADFMQ
jgi:triphosphoribosyl-dephospho-CoA synthase